MKFANLLLMFIFVGVLIVFTFLPCTENTRSLAVLVAGIASNWVMITASLGICRLCIFCNNLYLLQTSELSANQSHQ